MPVEIKQLIIRATIVDDGTAQGSSRTGAQPAAGSNSATPSDKAQLIAECVEHVMEILEERKER